MRLKHRGLAYISSPYSVVLRKIADEKYANQIIFQYARFGCRKALEKNLVPFSPILAFDKLFDEATQRDIILKNCLKAIERCQVFCIVKTGYGISIGMKREYSFAKKLEMPILEFEFTSTLLSSASNNQLKKLF